MARLQEIVRGLKTLVAQEGLTVSPEVILQEAVRIYNTEMINEHNSVYQKEKKNDKPTEKQIALLKKLNLPIPETKKEATILIRENINNKEKYQEY